MLGRHGEEGHAKQGVRARGEDADLAKVVLKLEGDFSAFRATEPILLKQSDVFREINPVQSVHQFLSIPRQIEEPLAHVLLNHGTVASPAPAGLDLFIGQDGRAGFTPVDGSLFAVGEPLFEELEEEPLVPTVVLRVVAFHQPVPIVGEPHALDLGGDARHVSLGDVVRVAAFRNRRVFSGHAKGIEAHRVEHVVSAHALVAGHSVANGVVSNVPHVHLARRVRVHFEAVEGRAFTFVGRHKHAFLVPAALPRHLIDTDRLVAHGRSSTRPSGAPDLNPTAYARRSVSVRSSK